MDVQKKLVAMFSGALGILLLLIITLLAFSKEKYKEIKKEEQKEREYIVDIALTHASSSLVNSAYDNTLWDALADYIAKPNPNWVVDNINTLLTTSDMQYIWIFNATGKQIYNIQKKGITELSTPFPDVNKYFDIGTKHVYHYYVNKDNTIIEIVGYSVHRSNDPDRKSAPNGYLFVGRVVSKEIIGTLKNLTNTKTYLYTDKSLRYHADEYQNVIYRNLLTWDNTEVAKFVFVSKDKLAQTEAEHNQTMIVVYVIFVILLIAFMFFIVKKSISDPLREIRESLDLKAKDPITGLERRRDEFGQIAKLMGSSFDQNQKIEEQYEKIQKQNRELEDLNATKDKFFSIIAHDLRNPFAVILSTTEFISNQDYVFTKEELIDFSKDINITAKSLFNLLENLLTWARAQRGTIPFEPDNFIVNDVVQNTIYVHTPQAEAKNIRIEGKVDKDLICFGDKNMASTILRNLLSNAIKFTSIGGVIRITAKKTDNNFVEFSVIDNGIGIPPENINKLFRIDVNVTTLGTTAEKGTGLGLILCKEFTEKNGGKIHVESELGKGSTFIFTFPVGKA